MTIYGQLLCVAAAVYRLLSIIEIDRRCTHEAYLSAQPSPQIQGSRFPEENGYFQRPQGSCPPPCQGPQGSVCLSTVSWVTTAKTAHSETGVCAGRMDDSPRSLFLFGTASKNISLPLAGPSSVILRRSDLEIHKVFL